MAAQTFGKLQLFEGPMCSGKSTELLATFLRMQANSLHKPIIFAHAKSRDASSGMIQTRTDLKCSASFISCLGKEQIETVLSNKHDAVFIDEAQFFTELGETELFDFCDELMSKGVDIYLAALDLDFQRRAWVAITRVRGLSPDCKKLSAYCTSCKKDAVYTSRISDSLELIDINATYEPACRSCYQRHQRQQTRNSGNNIA